MGLMDLASNKSLWRGLDYYEEKRYKSWYDLVSMNSQELLMGDRKSHIKYLLIQRTQESPAALAPLQKVVESYANI